MVTQHSTAQELENPAVESQGSEQCHLGSGSYFLENNFSVPEKGYNLFIPSCTGFTVQTLDMPQALIPLTLCRDNGHPPTPTIGSSALRSHSSELWNSTVSATPAVSSASEIDDVAFPLLLPLAMPWRESNTTC